MLQRWTDQNEEILQLLELYQSAGDVAAVTGAPFRRVIHLQRLYGPASCQEQRLLEDQQNERDMHRRMRKARSALREAQSAPDSKSFSPYKAYWQEYDAAHGLVTEFKPTPKAPAAPARLEQRQARMVPDDRADEELDFGLIMTAMVAGIERGGRRDGAA